LRPIGRGEPGAGRAEPIVDLFSVAGIAARQCLPAKRARLEMSPQRLEKVESAPGNGMAPAALDPTICGRDRRRD
jgi:hypothetical protein